LKKLPLDGIKKCLMLESSLNGKYAVAAFKPSGGPDRIKLSIIDPNLTSLSEILTITTEGKFKLDSIAISNDGALVAAVGAKDTGWLLVADTKTKKVLWEQTVKDTPELNKVIFSPDGQWVYASEPGRCIYVFGAADGKFADKLAMDKYQTPPNNPQTIGFLAISPDGRLFAATTQPASTAWIWNIETDRKIVSFSGRTAISGLAFSPDSSLLATGFLIRSNVNIWKIPQKTLKNDIPSEGKNKK
jgi:WD40 repeat protein